MVLVEDKIRKMLNRNKDIQLRGTPGTWGKSAPVTLNNIR